MCIRDRAGVQWQPLTSPGLSASAVKGPRALGLLDYFSKYLTGPCCVWGTVRGHAERSRTVIPTFRDPKSPRVIHSFCLFPQCRTTGRHLCPWWGCPGISPRCLCLGQTQASFEAAGHYSRDVFPTDREILYCLKSINDAQQIPGVPGRNYLMQLRR